MPCATQQVELQRLGLTVPTDDSLSDSRESVPPRVVQLNPGPEVQLRKFGSNSVHTAKYNIITFLPRFLFEQFSQVAYFYFLTQVCSSRQSVSQSDRKTVRYVCIHKCNVITFLPCFLFEQFSQVAYLYFLSQVRSSRLLLHPPSLPASVSVSQSICQPDSLSVRQSASVSMAIVGFLLQHTGALLLPSAAPAQTTSRCVSQPVSYLISQLSREIIMVSQSGEIGVSLPHTGALLSNPAAAQTVSRCVS